MSYWRVLILTHFLGASAAAAVVQFAKVTGLADTVTVIVLCSAVPAVAAAWWLSRGLRRFEARTPDSSVPTGIAELDALVTRLKPHHFDETNQWRDAQRLLGRLAPMVGISDEGEPGQPPGRVLMGLLGRMSRAASGDVGRVAALADTINQKACQSTSTARQQRAEVSRTIKFVEGLSTQIDLILKSAGLAADAATEAQTSATRGGELIQNLVRGMDRISDSVQIGEKRVLALAERFREIEAIVETMGSISARTDLLALNASIEAVRAGQDGSGFAVVAEEVRKLAEHTARASREISELVGSMQSETQETISTMTEERSQVQSESEHVGEAGLALERIHRSVTGLVEHVREISQASDRQLRGTQDIVASFQQLTELVQGLGRSTDDTREQSDQLTAAVRDLEDKISPLYRCDQFSSVLNERVTSMAITGSQGRTATAEDSSELQDELLSESASGGIR